MMILTAAAALAFQSLVPLHTDGESLVDPSGKKVLLRGVNFGSWFVEEIWMTPWKNKASASAPETVRDHDSLWSTIEKRLGHEAMIHVRDAWRDNWITQEDFNRVKAMGLNHVRLPILHDLIDEPGGMERLKGAIAMAKKAGLYVVLDMHGAPGGQSNEHHTGKENRNRLWFDVENIAEMERKWTRLATAFRDDPTVAVYDIMNEPMGAPNPAMLHLVYDRVIRAIRKVDPKKVVLVDDGYKGFDTTPHPNVAGWTNVAFSLHFYNFDAKKPEDHVAQLEKNIPKIKELQGYRNAPIYIGEFQLEPQFSATGLKQFTSDLTKQGWSWAMWTWKACSADGPVGNWGLYRPAGAIDAADPFHDSEAELIRKIKHYRTEFWTAPKDNVQALTLK
ncbi:MAG: cellulase family glycosylhydrolase [Armatimonadetes bacterium]|nr:cellulase family glycosylhydrolase [Armatimonadota bacterium]